MFHIKGNFTQWLACIILMPVLLIGCIDGDRGGEKDQPVTAADTTEAPATKTARPEPARPAATSSPQPAPLAVIDGEPISVDTFNAEMARRPGRAAGMEQKHALLDDMVRFEMLYAAARRAGYDQDPDILAQLKRMMVNKFHQEVIKPRLAGLTVTDAELEDYYRTHLADFVTPTRMRAAIIQITVPAGASEEKKAQLAQRIEAARAEALKLTAATRSFGAVAVKYSDHQSSRYRGGDTGWLQAGKTNQAWDQEVLQAMGTLSTPAEISPVITTSNGHYLIKLMDIQQSAPQAYAAVKERLRHRILNRKKAQVEQEVYAEVKANIPVRVYRDRLASIRAPEGGMRSKGMQPPALPTP